MRRFLLLGLVLATCPAAAEPRWKTELRKDLVQVKDGKYVVDRYSVCSVANAPPETATFQTRAYAEAPVDLMNRDHVVAYVTEANLLTVLGLTSGGAQVECRPAATPAAQVDLETRLLMTAEGMNWEIRNREGGSDTTSVTWADVFPEE